MRILFVHPECRTGPVGFRVAAMTEPLGLEILAGSVPEHEVKILDMRVEQGLDAALERFAPGVVAVTALTTEVYAACEIMEKVKTCSPEMFTVVGGHHATLIPEDFFHPYVDAICLGDGEKVFPQMLEALSAGRPLKSVPNLIWRDREGRFVHNGRIHEKTDADAIPLPRRGLVEKYRPEYFFLYQQPDSTVSTSRGCPYRCNFCSVWQFYNGRTCQMSVQRVIEEVRTIETRHMTFVDDNFLMNYRREMEIARRILAEGILHRFSMECRSDSIVRHPDLVEKWVEAGLFAVLVGLEGASDQMLREVDKKNTARVNDEAIRILRRNGVIIWGAFIVHPDWTADDFQVLKDYVTRKELTHVQYTVLTPLPGTQLYRQKHGQLLTDDYRCYDTLHAVLPTRLPREEFYQHFASLYGQTTLGPCYDLVSHGKYEMADLRRGYEMIKRMSCAEFYLENDPVLGHRTRHDGHPGRGPHQPGRARAAGTDRALP